MIFLSNYKFEYMFIRFIFVSFIIQTSDMNFNLLKINTLTALFHQYLKT
jgi:hypothetical protein